MEILGRPWIFLKVALYDAKSNIPWHDCPSPSEVVRAVCVDTIRSHVTSMASIEALIDI